MNVCPTCARCDECGQVVVEVVAIEEMTAPTLVVPPGNGTMEHVRGTLMGIAQGSAQPRCWYEYYGNEEGVRLNRAFIEIAQLLRALESAGVGSGRTVTVRFSA